MGGIGKLAATLATAAALSGSPVQAENPRDFSGLIESGYPGVSSVIENTQQSTSHLMQDTGTIVLAQAEVGKKEYVVYVRQVDANGNLTDKTVEVRYTKNERGVIVLPKTVEKLLDGRPLTGNPVEDRALNREILGKYDKDKQVILAMNSKEDIIGDARKKLRYFTDTIDTTKEITKLDLYNAYYSAYIFSFINETVSEKNTNLQLLSVLDNYASKKGGMNKNEVDLMKTKAREDAWKNWQSVTRALG